MAAKIIFKDKKGRFVKATDRFGSKVDRMYRLVRGKYQIMYDRFENRGMNLSPEYLAEVLPKEEFESLPEVMRKIKTVKPTGKYQLWDLAKKIDKIRNIRGKLLDLEIMVQDGKRIRTEHMNYAIADEGPANYKLFEAILRFLAKKGIVTKDRTDPLLNKIIDTKTDYGKRLYEFLSSLSVKSKAKKSKGRVVTIKGINVSDVL